MHPSYEMIFSYTMGGYTYPEISDHICECGECLIDVMNIRRHNLSEQFDDSIKHYIDIEDIFDIEDI